MSDNITRRRITVKGIVQVWVPPCNAKALRKLTGTVANTRDSVEIEVQGPHSAVQGYIDEFRHSSPTRLSHIFNEEPISALPDEKSFVIIE